jgi:hypothetical protein
MRIEKVGFVNDIDGRVWVEEPRMKLPVYIEGTAKGTVRMINGKPYRLLPKGKIHRPQLDEMI